MEIERWLPVVGYEGLYEVSDLGRVRGLKRGEIKKPTVGPEGRPFVLLWRNNECKNMKVHRLVMFAFVGAPGLGRECCHNDGNALNNRLDNLRWDTAQANQLDRIKHGTSNRGERCAAAKLKEWQALAIRADSRLQREIALDYGIRENTVSRIKSGQRWPHLAGR